VRLSHPCGKSLCLGAGLPPAVSQGETSGSERDLYLALMKPSVFEVVSDRVIDHVREGWGDSYLRPAKEGSLPGGGGAGFRLGVVSVFGRVDAVSAKSSYARD